MPLSTIALHFVASSEFEATFGIDDDGEFISLLYQQALGRDPDPGGYNHWLEALSSGQITRERLVVLFADSDVTAAGSRRGSG